MILDVDIETMFLDLTVYNCRKKWKGWELVIIRRYNRKFLIFTCLFENSR